MSDNPILIQIKHLNEEILRLTPKAGLIGGEWDRLMEVADFCSLLEMMARTRAHTDQELQYFLTQIKVHHKYVMDTVQKKRRPHPERGKRRFL